MILSLVVRSWHLTTGTGFNLKGGLWNRVAAARGTGNAVELGWQLGFGFEAKLTWRSVGEVHHRIYRGVEGVRKD
jgi:hypothetical protein